MRWPVILLFVYSVIISCHSPVSAPVHVGPSPGISATEPFDRHSRLIYTRHARCRMDCRHITDKEIHEVLDEGAINYSKSEPGARPDPKYAVEGFTDEQQHLRIIVAPENDKLIVITCIEIGVDWSCHCN